MEENICCVCHIRAGETRPELGGRIYCDVCRGKVTRDRRGLWWTVVVEIVALLIFVAVIAGIAGTAPTLEGTSLILAGILMALIPALIWLVLFYQQDRLEPEPKHFVLGVFILGAILANAVALPIIRDLFQVQDWIYTSTLSRILGSILVVGFVQEFLKYAAVRYTIYSSAEYDERVDGVIYATAAGLGFATMLNFVYVLDYGGVNLTVGAIRMVVNALAHASFAGVMGYFLGQAKFESKGPLWLPLGLCIAAILNGLFFYVEDVATAPQATLGAQGFQFQPIYGLVVAALIAVVAFAAVFFLIQQANKATLARRAGG